MKSYALVLKLLAPVFIIVAALHLVFGLQASAMLGAILSEELAAEPTLSSQDRFYGVAFAFYGVALYICATDIRRFEPILKALLWVFFLAGAARIAPWIQYGAPAPMVVALLVVELVVPPVLLLWLRKAKNAA